MSAINFPLATTSLFVNTLTTNKIIYLPAASTIGAGRLFYIKDICGNAARSSIYISTIGMDRIENRFQPSTLYALMSTNYGSVLMAPDGALNWYFLQHYHRNAISSLGSGVAAAAPSGPVSWKYVRFTLVLTRGQYSTKEWQMSEFTLKYQGSAVSYTGATISPVVGGGEDNPNLIDGNLGNKAFNTSISFTIFRESGFLFNAYTWATANDVPNRDPVRWIIDASQDNSTWTVLDNKSTADQTITTSRNTYVQDFSI